MKSEEELKTMRELEAEWDLVRDERQRPRYCLICALTWLLVALTGFAFYYLAFKVISGLWGSL